MQPQLALAAKAKKLQRNLTAMKTAFYGTTDPSEQIALAFSVFEEVSVFVSADDSTEVPCTVVDIPDMERPRPEPTNMTPSNSDVGLCPIKSLGVSNTLSLSFHSDTFYLTTPKEISLNEAARNAIKDGTEESVPMRLRLSLEALAELEDVPKVEESDGEGSTLARRVPSFTVRRGTRPHHIVAGKDSNVNRAHIVAPSPPRQPNTSRPHGRSHPLRPSSAYSTHSLQSVTGRAPVVNSDSVCKCVDDIGNKRINQYEVLDELGRGAYGKVKLVVDTTTEDLRAIKIMNKSVLQQVVKPGGYTALHQAQREVAIMKKLKHRHLVQLYEVLDDPEQNKMYLVMQYVEGKLLQDDPDAAAAPGAYVPLRPTEVRKYMLQLTAALRYLHNHGIFHRDVKPDNILKGSDDNVYVADFGVSELTSDTLRNVEGTPAFFAPEMTSASDLELDGAPLDVWALGVTLHCMLFGRNPFIRTTAARTRNAIQHLAPSFPTLRNAKKQTWSKEDEGLYAPLCDLIKLMLDKNPDDRITLLEARHHHALSMEADVLTGSFETSDDESVLEECTTDDVLNAIQSIASISYSPPASPTPRRYPVKLRTAVSEAALPPT